MPPLEPQVRIKPFIKIALPHPQIFNRIMYRTHWCRNFYLFCTLQFLQPATDNQIKTVRKARFYPIRVLRVCRLLYVKFLDCNGVWANINPSQMSNFNLMVGLRGRAITTALEVSWFSSMILFVCCFSFPLVIRPFAKFGSNIFRFRRNLFSKNVK